MQCSASDFQLGTAELTGTGAGDGAAQRLRHGLEAVTDAEDRHIEVEQRRVELRRTLRVDTGRSAGQHHRLRFARFDLLDCGGVRNHLGVDPRLAHPSRDQLRILRTEVDHQHRPRRRRFH